LLDKLWQHSQKKENRLRIRQLQREPFNKDAGEAGFAAITSREVKGG
jgi:hypothetical protein